jgi:hypothetical protein
MAEQKWPSWPAWYYGPGGAAAIFERADDIPEGWADAPGKAVADPIGHHATRSRAARGRGKRKGAR